MLRILLKALFLNLLLIALFNVPPCQAAKPMAIPTFHSIGIYFSPNGGSEDNACHVHYKILGERGWKQGQDLWFDARNREYRGSLVNLIPGITYKIKLTLEKTGRSRRVIATTWKEQFPIGDIVYLPSGTSGATVHINESGTPDAYRLYTHPEGADTIIDVSNGADHCLEIRASYVIIRGLILKNARIHGIRLMPGVHDVIIEDCDISGWGQIAEDGWGKNEHAGIYSNSADNARIIIQRNKIHHPRSDTNSWKEHRAIYGYHPAGPKAITLKASAGGHVIRYNEIYSDDDHYFNDAIGESGNFGPGFPNADTDIYGNFIERCWDDGIESEGHNRNVRIWGNYIDRTTIGIAAAPVHEGPLYIWRNVMHSSRKGPLPEHNYGQPLIKLGGGRKDAASPYYGDGKTYIFHNTSLLPSADTGLAGHSTQINGDTRELRNCVTRNNVLESAGDGHHAIFNRTEDPQNDFDYDLYNGLIYWGADIFELNGVQGRPVYTKNVGFDPDEGTGNFHQTASSPGYDTGLPIANFNDDFTGEAPDMGAHETGTPPMGFGVAATYLKPQGLVGFWPFDEKRNFSDIIDKSGNGNTGAMHGDVFRRKGEYGRALKFKGDSDYVEIADPGESALDIAESMSIALWVKRTRDTAGDQWFLSKPGAYAWKFSNGRAYFYIYTPHEMVIESSPIPGKSWHHLAAVYDFSEEEVRIYIDGVPDAAQPVTGAIATTNESLIFGHPSDACLFGKLDDIHLYERVLSEDEIQELAGITKDNSLAAYFDLEEGLGTAINDISGNGNTGDVFGNTSWVTGKSGTALEFHGDTDHVQIADNSGSLTIAGDFSIALWLKRTKRTQGDEWFFSKPGTYAWKITNDTPYFLIYTPDITVVTPSKLDLNRWHHLVATYDQSTQTVTIYIDGELDTSAAVGAELNLTSFDHTLGHESDACLNGILDDVQVYNKALSLSEVQALYGTLQTSHMAGHWALDDGAGSVVTDTSGHGNDGTLEGDTAWGEGKSGTAVSFDGKYDYIHIPDTSGDLNIPGDLSISLWIKRTASTRGDEWFIRKDFAYGWKLSNSIPYFFIWTPHLTLVEPAPGTTIGADNEWHHLVAVYDTAGESVLIYIDGVLNTSHTVSGELAQIQGPLILGTDNDAGMIGMVDDVRIVNTALRAEEVHQLYMDQ
ncbi:hypothetical protein D3OALGA1CA_5854 [Olavius algarvensis associated proteobacterium Delta 3]|nr:hypothetical protein D3OALGA1CA_5854 [Olavius algarvensis associated proteobacterium Delta 3]